MNTVLERKIIINDAMRTFEKKTDMLNIVYVYSQLVKDLASDRPDDFQRVLFTLHKESKGSKNGY